MVGRAAVATGKIIAGGSKRWFACFIYLIAIGIALFGYSGFCYGETIGTIEEVIDLSGLEEFLGEMNNAFDGQLEEFHLDSLWQQVKSGDFHLDMKEIGRQLLGIVFQEVNRNKKLFTQLIVVAMAALFLQMLSSNFLQGGVATLTHAIVYLALIAITLTSFRSASDTALSAVTGMSDLFYALMPLLMTILAGIGGVTTVSIVHPLVLAGLSMAMILIRRFIFPLIYFATVLKIVSYISPRFNLEKLSVLGKDIALGLLGITMSVFIGLLGIAGVGASSIDGLTMKAAKMATGTFIPVIGRSLADALDGILGTSLLLKNGIGFIGVVAIFFLCALPAIKVLVMAMVYRLIGALLQPLGDEKLATAVSGIGNSLLLVFAVLVATGILFFFTISLLVAMGNITMMMR